MIGNVLTALVSLVVGIVIGVGMADDLMKDRIEAGAFSTGGVAYIIKPMNGE